MSKLKNKKISEKLLQLIKPYMKVVEDSNSEQRLASLLVIGTAAWNMSITGQEELKNIVLKPINDKEALSEMKKMFDSLVRRKNTLFPDDYRIILNCKVNSVKRKKHDLSVSFLHKDEYEKSSKNLLIA